MKMMRKISEIVVDLETTIRCDTHKNKASPFFPGNEVVLAGFLYSNTVFDKLILEADKYKSDIPFPPSDTYITMLIGHNIKFDLLYLKRDHPAKYKEWINAGGVVWDTQVVEYLLSGQSKLYPSLDYCAEKYGGTLKDDKIKVYWNNDIDTTDIPKEELVDYLKHDLDNTMLVYEAQLKQVEDKNLFALVTTQMDALLALVEMESNGMTFDQTACNIDTLSKLSMLEDLEKTLTIYIKRALPKDMIAEPSLNSPQQISLFLYGGDVKCSRDVEVLNADGTKAKYKSGIKKGTVKTKKHKYIERIPGAIVARGRSIPSYCMNKSGKYSTDSSVLERLYNHGFVIDFLHDFIKFRTLYKEIFTYNIPLTQQIFPDGLIHANFNQTATATGRLSCTNPNLQNQITN